MILRNSSTGFCVLWIVFSHELFEIVGISNTSLGLAPKGLGSQTYSVFLPFENWEVSA
jgi:hypothetical protein